MYLIAFSMLCCSSSCLERLLSSSWWRSFSHWCFWSRTVCWMQSWITCEL